MATRDPSTAWEWGDCLLSEATPSRELAAAVRKTRGFTPAWLARLAPCPWLAYAVNRFTASPIAHLPFELWDLTQLVVSRDNSCRFCYGAQRSFMKLLGYRDAALDRIENDLQRADLGATEVAALEFARKMSRADPRPQPGELDALERAGLSRVAVAELAFAASVAVFANRVSTLVALPPDPHAAALDHPLARLVRPILAWRLTRRHAPPEPLPDPNPPPCAGVVAALEGSPAARALRKTIDAALASNTLPRRTKLLVLAVVARALGCSHGEREARADLVVEGLAPDTIDETLAHLGSPALDPIEALLVPFARETVRAPQRPAVLQARLREALGRLPPDVLLEVVGILALTNAVCRLSVLLERC